MPKVTSKNETLAKLLINRPPGENTFRRAGDKIFCSVCNSSLGTRKSILDAHIKTSIHIRNATRKSKQLQIRESLDASPRSEIGLELVEAFLAANIALNKLSNPYLKRFLENYVSSGLAGISTMRKLYVNQLYQKLFVSIKERIIGKQ